MNKTDIKVITKIGCPVRFEIGLPGGTGWPNVPYSGHINTINEERL